MKKIFVVFCFVLGQFFMQLFAHNDYTIKKIQEAQTPRKTTSKTTHKTLEMRRESQDFLMLKAADLMLHSQIDEALEIYKKLYESTHAPHFLKQIAMAKAQNGELESALDFARKYQSLSQDSDDVETNLIIIENHIKNSEFSTAASLLERVNAKAPTLQTRYILANLYLHLNKKDLALQNLVAMYNDANDESGYGSKIKLEALERIVGIYLERGDVESAFKLLDSHIASNEYSVDAFLPLYVKFNRLEALRAGLYKRFSEESNIENLRMLVATLLEAKKSDEAISLLKTNESLFGNDSKSMLMSIYASKNDFNNAKSLANEIYNDSKNIEYLGLSVVYGFENISVKDKTTLKPTIDTLKYVIEQRAKKLKDENKNLSQDDAFYYNFLGYILIDYDIDVKDGLKYVSKAVALVPDSIEYLDSLAWGLYKDKDCKRAKETMQLIPQNQMQKIEEIKQHYDLIEKNCGVY